VKSPLKVAVFQMATTFDVLVNARKVKAAIESAAGLGANLLILPECALSGYLPRRDLDFGALETAEAEVARCAAGSALWLALGTTRRRGGKWRNVALLCSPGGTTSVYEKTHLTPDDALLFAAGDELPVFRAGAWTVAMQICFDMRFAENWRILRRKGAELVIHLSNASLSDGWKVPVLEGAIRSRAADNGMFVASANDARAPQMMVSAVCDPDGRDLARAPENEETILVAEIDRSAVKSNFLEARRTDLWGGPENAPFLLS